MEPRYELTEAEERVLETRPYAVLKTDLEVGPQEIAVWYTDTATLVQDAGDENNGDPFAIDEVLSPEDALEFFLELCRDED